MQLKRHNFKQLHLTVIYTKLENEARRVKIIWKPQSLCELTSSIYNTELTYLGLEASNYKQKNEIFAIQVALELSICPAIFN